MPIAIHPDESIQINPSEESTKKQGTSIIIKFRDNTSIPYVDSLEEQFEALGLSGLAEIFDEYPGMTVRRLIVSVTPEDVKALEEPLQSNGKHFASLLSFFSVLVPVDVKVYEVIEKLRKDESIENVYLNGEVTDAHLDTRLKDPKMSAQAYLDKAPGGIDAFTAWKVPGGCGAGVIFMDIELGWKIDHEDLRALGIKSLPKGNPIVPDSHGTGVLGIVVGIGHNNRGVIGIAHDAQQVIVCSDRDNQGQTNDATLTNAIETVTNEMKTKGRKGDILLLEAQRPTKVGTYKGTKNEEIAIEGDHGTYFPVEIAEVVCKAIQTAVANGIIVIEAAGNGTTELKKIRNKQGKEEVKWVEGGIGVNLDAFTNASNNHTLNRDMKNEFVESGAIMIAAARSSQPHDKMSFSNYGNRIDCNAWGENVTTTSIDDKNNDTYVNDFSGTSSASAIIAGAALCVQGISKDGNKATLTPVQMRDLLSPYKERIASPKFYKIGVMPDLKKIIESGFKAI